MNSPDLGEHCPVAKRETKVKEPVRSRAHAGEQRVGDQLGVEAERNCGQETENVAHENQVVTAGVRVLDDATIVELVVDEDEDDGDDDANDADNDHRNINCHSNSLNICLDDCSVLWRISFGPPD